MGPPRHHAQQLPGSRTPPSSPGRLRSPSGCWSAMWMATAWRISSTSRPGHVTVWINRRGNAWSDPIVIHGTPPVTDADAVRLADMLGTGTDGILWTYDFGAFPDSTYKFLDLTGGIKPYLLDRMDNHMGAVTRVVRALHPVLPGGRGAAETRWRTPLPFPVQVVARVEVIDQISQRQADHRVPLSPRLLGRGGARVPRLRHGGAARHRDVRRLPRGRRCRAEAGSSRYPTALLPAAPHPDLVPPGAGGRGRRRLAGARLVAGVLAGRSSGTGARRKPSTRSCARSPIRATGATPCGPCAGACCAPSSTPSTAQTRRTAPTP